MPAWSTYPNKTTLDTDDTFLLADSTSSNKPVRQISYDALADAILNKLTSKTYSTDIGATTLPNAINALNAKTALDIYVGSTILVPETIEVTDNDRHNIFGAYENQLIGSLLNGIDVPNGYRTAARLSALVRTDNSGAMEVGFNGIPLISRDTWSTQTYRIAILSDKFYSYEDFPSESVNNSTNGLNLYVKLNSPSTVGEVYGITLIVYFEKI